MHTLCWVFVAGLCFDTAVAVVDLYVAVELFAFVFRVLAFV